MRKSEGKGSLKHSILPRRENARCDSDQLNWFLTFRNKMEYHQRLPVKDHPTRTAK